MATEGTPPPEMCAAPPTVDSLIANSLDAAVDTGRESGMSASDALVVFGITGDLAKRMTLQSLYRLELSNSLEVPIIGVAGDDWTLDHLRQHARESIEAAGITIDVEVFERFAGRLSYVSGDFAD